MQIRLLACLLLLGFAGIVRATSPSAPLPIEAFFGLPAMREPELSPDGSKIAFLFPKDGKLALGLFDRKTGEGRIILEAVKENVEFFFWKGSEHLVFAGDVGGNELFFIGVTDLTGKKIQRVMESRHNRDRAQSVASIVNTLPLSDEEFILAGYFISRADWHAEDAIQISNQEVVARYNIRTKARAPVFSNGGDYDGFFTDNDGQLRLASRKQGGALVWFSREPGSKSPMVELARFPLHGYAETWEPLGFAADNKTFYLVSREEQDRGALYAYNTETRTRGPALFVPPEGEITNLVMNRDRTKLLGVAYLSDRPHYHWFDPARADIQQKLEHTFPGFTCRIVSSSADEKVRLVYVGNDREPGAYYVLDLKQPSLTLFKRIRPEVDPARMRPMETVNFTARDGLPLQGYLTRPAGDGQAAGPLVLFVHGGPFGIRDDWGFDNEVQFLASRGFAVLQVNYRGSGGYGRDFINKGRQQWGRAMQDDLTDAVKWAVAQGIADPRRVAIYGASYGGYAALAGVTLTPELYRCAVNYVGVANLEVAFKGYGGDAFQTAGNFDYQKTWVAPDNAYAAATSPLNFVERIRVPTLHAYGEKDARVEFKQWLQLRDQLDKFHKPYQFLVEGEQGHGFRNESSSLKFHRALEQFLAENLAPSRP